MSDFSIIRPDMAVLIAENPENAALVHDLLVSELDRRVLRLERRNAQLRETIRAARVALGCQHE